MVDIPAVRQVRRLPAVPVPLPGEALLSWLDYFAAECEVDRAHIAEACGVLGRGEGAVGVSAAGRLSAVFGLSDLAIERVAAATGLLADEARSMTWMRFAGTALPAQIIDIAAEDKVPAVKSSWIDPAELRFCPSCVDKHDGRWPLVWSTPWAFACLSHECYLLAACPVCREPVRAGTVRLGRGSCLGFVREAQGGGVRRCGIPYRDMEAPSIQDVLLADVQARLEKNLSARGQGMAEARGDFADLAAAAEFAWFLATPEDLSGADSTVVDRFTVFSLRYSATAGRYMSRKDRAASEPMVRTACLRIAAQIVFSDDPWAVAMGISDFASRPVSSSVRPLQRSWYRRPRQDTTQRMAPFVSAVRAPALLRGAADRAVANPARE